MVVVVVAVVKKIIIALPLPSIQNKRDDDHADKFVLLLLARE